MDPTAAAKNAGAVQLLPSAPPAASARLASAARGIRNANAEIASAAGRPSAEERPF